MTSPGAPISIPRAPWWRAREGYARVWVTPCWKGDGGVRQLLDVAIPMVLTGLTVVTNLMFDRILLARYDIEFHMPATQGAGAAWWTIQHTCGGVVGYATTFVAQYHGSNRLRRVGPSVWQALYLALACGALNLLLYPMWGLFFEFVHGAGKLSLLEGQYAATLSFGSVFLLIGAAFGSFYAGLGKTRFVFGVGALIAVTNVILNRWLIFNPPEWLPFIEPGVVGAAWATNFSLAFGALVYALLVLHGRNEAEYATRSGWRFDARLLKRLVRFGLPQSYHHFIEVASFTFFFLMVGRVSQSALIASNIAGTVNMVVFIPMIGMGQSVGILLGRFIGNGRTDLAERITCTGTLINFALMVPVALVYTFMPDLFINLFITDEMSGEIVAAAREYARLFLLVVAIYSIGDVFNVTYASAIKGAGDTKFVFIFTALSSLVLLIIPCALLGYFGGPPLLMWILVMLFVMGMGGGFFLRFRSGHWKHMKVIEPDVDLVAEDTIPIR
ncbi:MAG: multidrug resistance protein family [Candidatus Sumerlaeota bacterium]|nr:multidrug resistance protein family [Candidatus Sumerlaeota bacterium]